jgi:hypothetical protein
VTLRLHAAWPNASHIFAVVTEEGLRCGSISKSSRASMDPDTWHWDIFALFPGRVTAGGRARTREAAVEAFTATWERYRAMLTAEEWEAHLWEQHYVDTAAASWQHRHNL